jgi:hypothetical protein
MNASEKEQILTSLIQKLHDGVSEDLVKEEYLKYFPEAENAWEKSMKTRVPEIKKDSVVSSYQLERDPLVLLAEENGALRALLKNLYFDLSSERQDDVTFNMIDYEIHRLLSIRLHYEKIQSLLFPLLEERGVKNLKEVEEKENEVVSSLAELADADLKKEEIKEAVVKVLDQIESNIVYENHFLLPVLDGTLLEAQKEELLFKELEIGLTLLRGINIL